MMLMCCKRKKQKNLPKYTNNAWLNPLHDKPYCLGYGLAQKMLSGCHAKVKYLSDETFQWDIKLLVQVFNHA